MKLSGATNKRLYFFMSAICRAFTFIGCLIAYIVIKIAVNPEILWLNLLMLFLSLGSLLSGLFNLCLCGLTATGYTQNRWIQIINLMFTCVTGGIASTTFTAIAVSIRPTQEEIDEENLIKVKKKY